MAMDEAGRQRMRELGSRGGRATVAKYGRGWMSAIGKAGFQTALALGWGPQLAEKLGGGYQAKYGHPLVLGPQAQKKNRIRAAARRHFGPQTCDEPGCGAPAQIHHVNGLDDTITVAYLCAAHHRDLHRRRRRAHLRLLREEEDA